MKYREFAKTVEKRMKELYPELTIELKEIAKNNQTKRIGICFFEREANVSPTIYLEGYYERFLEVEDVDLIIYQIQQLYEKVRVRKSFDIKPVEDYSNINDKIVVRLINRKANEKMLRDIPYIPYLDLAIVFYILVELDEYKEQIATMAVTNEHLEIWGVTKETMYQAAIHNSERLLPTEMTSILEIIEELYPEWNKSEVNEDDFMYVLTNDRRSFGASAVLYPDQLEVIGMYLKENFYVLPSSLHEVIILPESKSVGKEELEIIVKEINRTQVPAEEILSDSVYYYDRKTKELK